jgi:hypothetical protein
VELGANIRLLVILPTGEQDVTGATYHVPAGALAFDFGERVDANQVMRVFDGGIACRTGVLHGTAEWTLENGQQVELDTESP